MITDDRFQASFAHFFSPIRDLLDDPRISEIMINGPASIWAERAGTIAATDCRFPSDDDLIAALNNVAQFCGRTLNDQRPILEAFLPDGSRIEAIFPPLASPGPAVAIRRFSRSTVTIEHLINNGTLSPEAGRFLSMAIRKKKNMVVSGGTGSGKTTFLGALSSFIPPSERTIVLEDTRELKLQQPHVIYLETRSPDERGRGGIALRDLLRATLRMRPDRIVIGEVRGAEALDLIQALTSGHGGSMTTVHASTPADALRRLETLAMMDRTRMPRAAIQAQVQSAVQLIVQVTRRPNGSRVVSEISKVERRPSGEEYRLEQLFVRERSGLVWRGDHRKENR